MFCVLCQKLTQDNDLKFGKTKGGLVILTSVCLLFCECATEDKIRVASASLEFHSNSRPNSRCFGQTKNEATVKI